MKNEKNYNMGFLFQKYGKFWSVSRGHFIKHKPLISEECTSCSYLFEMEKENRTFSRSDHCNDPFPNHKLHIQIIIIWCYHYYSKQLFAKNENVYSKIFLKLMKNQYFQFFLRHWFLNLWRLINIWIWYLELAFIPLWLIRKKESDQIKIRKIILKLWVFELIWGKTFCSSFGKNDYHCTLSILK